VVADAPLAAAEALTPDDRGDATWARTAVRRGAGAERADATCCGDVDAS